MMLSKHAFVWTGLGILLAAASAQAGTMGGLYDMRALINEGHPFVASDRVPMPAAMPAAMAPAPTVTAMAPPAPTLRHTPPPRPPRPPRSPATTAQTAQTAAASAAKPYRSFADSTDDGWFDDLYVAAGGWINQPNDLDGTTNAGAAFNIELNPGLVFQAAIGSQFAQYFRVEAEAAYRMADFDRANTGGAPVTTGGDLKIATAMLNLFFDFDLGPITPYVGAGAGVALINSSAIAALAVKENDATEFAYQAIIGASKEFFHAWHIGLDGRYLGTSDEDVSAFALTMNLRHKL